MAETNVLELDQPLKTGGIRSVNFFNGRLLAGRDLTREQNARREADWRLGLALGDGVASGLEVLRDEQHDRPAAPVVRVRAGLAVNRAGQTLRLSADRSVALARRFDVTAADRIFDVCDPVAGGTYIAGAGVYLLTIAPVQVREGAAATNGLDPSSVTCNTDVIVEGVQFRLLAIDAHRYADLDIASQQFRNRLAHRCFGTELRHAASIDLWRVDPPSYGLIDELRTGALTEQDVPLALIYWTTGGIQFVDTWAVRRQLMQPDALSGFSFMRDPLHAEDLSSFAFIARRRRLVEAHAMCAQFQQQLADVLAAHATPASVSAAQYFRHLPPFGVVPLHSAPLRGFNEAMFFSGLVRRPAPVAAQETEFIDARVLGPLHAQALTCGPTDVTQREFIHVYRVWQNVRAADAGEAVQRMVVFASGQLPNLAVARFDMARSDYSNFASCCGGS